MRPRLSFLAGLSFILLIGSVACSQTNKTTDGGNTYDKSQIIALLQPNVQPNGVTTAFKSVGLTVKGGPASRTENKWLFTYDTTKIDADEMLQNLIDHKDVVSAEFVEITTTPDASSGNN